MTDEPKKNDVNDEFRHVMEGLRTTLPGTQALFGFLLIVPFQGAFGDFDAVARGTFYTAFIGAALSSVLLIAPSVHQRVRAPLTGVSRQSDRHLAITIWVTILGSLAFAVALVAAVFLVSRVIFGTTTTALATAGIVLPLLWSWFYLPLVTFRKIR